MSAAPIKTLVAVDGAIDRRALEGVLGDPGIEVVEVLETHGELADRAGDLQIDAMLVACNGHPDVALAYVAEAARERPELADRRRHDLGGVRARPRGVHGRRRRHPDPERPRPGRAGDVLRAAEGRDATERGGERCRRHGRARVRAGPEGRDRQDADRRQPRHGARAGRSLDGRGRPRPPVRRLRAGARLRARPHDLRSGHVGRHARRREARGVPRDPPVGAPRARWRRCDRIRPTR